jgi:hypothetical protein
MPPGEPPASMPLRRADANSSPLILAKLVGLVSQRATNRLLGYIQDGDHLWVRTNLIDRLHSRLGASVHRLTPRLCYHPAAAPH